MPSRCTVRKLASGCITINNSVRIDKQNMEVVWDDSLKNSIIQEPIKNHESDVSTTCSTNSSSSLPSDIDVSFSPLQHASTSWWDNSDIQYMNQCPRLSPEDEKIVQKIFSKLTDKEIEIASATSYRYYHLEALHSKAKNTVSPEILRKAKNDVIKDLIRRYLEQHQHQKNKMSLTLQDVQFTLQFRDERGINQARFCFHVKPNSKQAREDQHLIKRFIGDRARACVINYDREGRANVLLTGRFNFIESKDDLEGFLGSHGYLFERALACTQTKTNGKLDQVNIVLDFHGFVRRHHALPMFMLTELLSNLKAHFPGRVYGVYMIDAPYIAKFVYNIVKPFTTHMAKEIKFLNGKKQRELIYGKRHDSYTRTELIDMEKYYHTPFDKTWEDIYG